MVARAPLWRRAWTAACAAALLTLAAAPAASRPITTKEGVLPPGTELNEEQLDQPNELFYSELAGGKRSYLLNLGDLLFSSPNILGGVARQAGISCGTCHQQGSANANCSFPACRSGRAPSIRPAPCSTRKPITAYSTPCASPACAAPNIWRPIPMMAASRHCANSSATPSSMNSPAPSRRRRSSTRWKTTSRKSPSCRIRNLPPAAA